MSSESDDIPAGWYPAPHGGQRYWDGQRWLALPDPDESTSELAEPAFPAEKTAGSRRWLLVASVVAVVLLAASAAGFLIWKSRHDAEMRNAASVASSSKAAADAEADRIRRETEAKRAERGRTVKEIESAVKDLAEKHVANGLFDGPILSVSCDPVGGGSTDDLTAKTTIFECFAATKDNGDGTLSGRKYHATMNWDSGQYTYGFGAPG